MQGIELTCCRKPLVLEFDDNGFSGFFDICRTTLDQHATSKEEVCERQSYAIY